MIVDVIGTSCTWFERKNTSYVIDKKIILDTPSGAYKDIIKVMDLFKAEAIIISHFHSDHFVDLMPFATQIARHGEKHGRTEKLKIFGPKGIAQRLIDLNKVLVSTPEECSLESYSKTIEFIELYDGYEFSVCGYKVKTYQMTHGDVETYGFVFTDENGVSVGFTADSGMCESVKKILGSSKYAFVDMASPNSVPNDKHMNIPEFLENVKNYPNAKLFPIHTCDENQQKAIEMGLNFVVDGQVLDLR